MRIRTIKPEFWQNEGLAEVSESAALLAVALLNYVDDEGYFNANPKLIQASLFPLRTLSTPIPHALRELDAIGYIDLRFTDKQSFGHIVHFVEHQRISHPRESVLRGKHAEGVRKMCGMTAEDARSMCIGNGMELELEMEMEPGRGPGETKTRTGAVAPIIAAGDDGCRVEKKTKRLKESFARFWAAYPRKIAKAAAERKWLTIAPSDEMADRMIAKVNQQKSSDQWTKDGGQFIPHPATWLNGGRWDDELEPAVIDMDTNCNAYWQSLTPEQLAEMERQT